MINKSNILYEDNHLIAVNKPAGLLVQGDKTGDETLEGLTKEYIGVTYNKPGKVYLGLVHRIDRPVSGVVLMTKTSKAAERISKAFQNKEVKKTYLALVKNPPEFPSGELTHWLVKDNARNKTKYYDKPNKKGQKAVLKYEVIDEQKGFYLLRVAPITGRPHQIRVQLAAMGCPIKGDLKYGYEEANADGNICLQSNKLVFTHPVKKEPMAVEAPRPDWL